MIQPQRLTGPLTPLDAALRLLLDGVSAVTPADVPIDEAAGCVCAETRVSKVAIPEFDVAATDGWALRARDLVGATSYSPLQLMTPPPWVEAGERMPENCDCVVDSGLVETTGSMFQVTGEAAPGQGVRRAGEDVAASDAVVAEGMRLNHFNLLAANAAGLKRLKVRRPHVRVVDVPSRDGASNSAQFVAGFARASGCRVTLTRALARDAKSISTAIDVEPCDLLLTVGGTGSGRTDATIEALTSRGGAFVHGIALQPGRTAAVSMKGTMPIIAIPGAPEQAVAVCLAIVRPLIEQLSGHAPQQGTMLPLARKISSAIGFSEVVLLERSGDRWIPGPAGHLSLGAVAKADAWLIVPGDSEGYAAGTATAGLPLHENRLP
ncbi:MAG: molybdopterin-binding protein [Rhizobiales bacterium]|nr:molybdopterin-binding protein [Hyphomicrobiales bacterium]